MSRGVLGVVTLLLVLAAPARADRISDLTTHAGAVPKRLVGYGIVVGLDGTGDRSFGGSTNNNATIRSVLNVLRRFDIEIPANQLRARDVAAVLVTAEMSPYLRAGGRFDVQVAAMGDATSLRGGVLWMTPLVSAPGAPALASAQGPLSTSRDTETFRAYRLTNSGRIPDGGVVEVDDATPQTPPQTRLLLRQPDLRTASHIATVIKAAFGDAAARVDDPGAVTLAVPSAQSKDVLGFLAAVDTLPVQVAEAARIVISGREGTLAAGGDIKIASAVVSHHGITLQIGGTTAPSPSDPKLLALQGESSVQDVAAALHAAGADATEMAAMFEALRSSGALRAEVVIR